jgi:uncharacterized membrane protein
MDPYELTTRIEEARGLDRPGTSLERLLPPALRAGPVRDLLAGAGLGHALHPPLTDVPMGMWMGTAVLDVLGPRRWRWPAATLNGVGLVASVPTIASGLVEWREVDPPERRVGLVHAAANGVATAAFLVSLGAKIAGRTRLGAFASLTGMTFAGAGGYLGGHLAFARGAGVDRPSGRA